MFLVILLYRYPLFVPRRKDRALDLGCLASVYSKVGEAIYKAHSRMKTYYNRKRRVLEFQVGDLVWKRTYPLSNAAKFFMAK